MARVCMENEWGVISQYLKKIPKVMRNILPSWGVRWLWFLTMADEDLNHFPWSGAPEERF